MNNKIEIHPDGIHIEYFSNGKKKSQKTWKDGKLNGPAVFWDKKGNRVREGNLVNNKINGKWHYWNFNNQREEILTWKEEIVVKTVIKNRHNRIVYEGGVGIDSISLQDKFYKQITINHEKASEAFRKYAQGNRKSKEIKPKLSLLEKHKLKLIGGETQGNKINRSTVDYIHVSNDGYKHDEFVQLYYTEFCKLNDYFYLTLESVDKYSKLSNDMKFNFTNDDSHQDKFIEIIKRFSNSHGYSNDEVGVIYAPASCLSLLYFFTISHLKDLNINFNLDEYYEYVYNSNYKRKLKKDYDKKNGKSPSEFEELLYLLDYLKLQIGTSSIEKTSEAIELITVINKIRNKYAHGEFHELKGLMQEINIRDTLITISSFFKTIHNAIFDSHRDEDSLLFDERWVK